jgi:hypothetical protein
MGAILADAARVLLVLLGVPLLVWAAERARLTWIAWRSAGVAAVAPAPAAEDADVPFVTVQLPLYNEPEVAERLVDAACALDWPRHRFEVQVLDDSTDATSGLVAARVAAARARGVDAIQVRRADRRGYKAGALAHGLASARGELVLVLDADFVPEPPLLRRAWPHFADPEVAVVQLRWAHLNRSDGWLTEAQALMLDGHFSVEQRARHAAGLWFNFNGTAGLWRRAAIDDAGGWSADTLTEDLDLSYRAQLAGWRFVYLDDESVPAELPATMAAFLGQQYRWAKGSVQCARKLAGRAFRAKVSRAVRLEALLHLSSNFAYPMSLVLALLLGALALPPVAARAGGVFTWLAAAAPWSAVATLAYVAYYLAAQRRVRGPFAALVRVPLVMAVGLGLSVNQTRAVWGGLFGPSGEFVRTPKTGAGGPGRVARPVRPARRRLPLAEAGLAIYSLVTCASAVAGGLWLVVPYLALATIGFAWVAAALVLE